MSIYKIKKGLEIPLLGAAGSVVESASRVSSVGVVAADVRYLRPRLLVSEGDAVKVGSPLFEDKSTGVRFTSPAGGIVKGIHRGAKRRLLSVEVAPAASEETEPFQSISLTDLPSLDRKVIVERLNDSGCWAALRRRPFGSIPSLEETPHSIFVSVLDTNPLPNHPPVIIRLHAKAFTFGLRVLECLTEGEVHVCKGENADIPYAGSERIRHHIFTGSHPAGLVGTQIHFIDPISSPDKAVWHIGYQDVIRIGLLFMEGRLDVTKYVSLGGPQVHHPRILKTRIGANLNDLLQSELKPGDNRIVSGSPLSGRKVESGLHFIGLYANSLAVLEEDKGRYFQDFMTPGLNKFSLKAVFLSSFTKNKQFALKTSTHGSHRTIVPIGGYEEVFPLRILATPLMKALLSKDLEVAEQLGVLELEGEDLALCTFICPGKNDMAGALEEVLAMMHAEMQSE